MLATQQAMKEKVYVETFTTANRVQFSVFDRDFVLALRIKSYTTVALDVV